MRVIKNILRGLFKLIMFIPVYLIVFFKYKIHAKRKNLHKVRTQHIIDGFANLAFENPKVETLAKLRAIICGQCPEAIPIGNITQAQPDGETKSIKGLKCNQCGCLLSAKVRSLDSYCPLSRW